MKIQTRTLELTGSSYEIGQELGRRTADIPTLRRIHTAGAPGFDSAEVKQATELFDRWCPGLSEELLGFADALEASPTQIVYYAMTYLRPSCSHMALLPSMTREGRPLVARNYEFSHEAEDFTLVKTSAKGKYAHLGTSVLQFGRDDGMNEKGLSVTMSSCGFPVGAQPNMRKPKLVGLQFWAVVRSLLENCKNVEEALDFLADMPIAYNLNLILADKNSNAALVETLDGRHAVKRIPQDGSEAFLAATNHVVLPELIPHQPQAMRHSLTRYEWIWDNLHGAHGVTGEDLKKMLLSPYPNGLCCHCYKDFFGTTKSMVMDPVCGTIELCWGGRRENGWNTYRVAEPLAYAEQTIELQFDRFDPKMADFLPIRK